MDKEQVGDFIQDNAYELLEDFLEAGNRDGVYDEFLNSNSELSKQFYAWAWERCLEMNQMEYEPEDNL